MTGARDVVLSVRVSEAEVEFLRWRAQAAGRSVSEEIRAALGRTPPYVVIPATLPARPPGPQIGWKCQHATVTHVPLPGAVAVPGLWCGCRMTPVYADTNRAAS